MEVFKIDCSQIKDRIDPLNFQVLMEIEKEIINKAKFKIDKIEKVCDIQRGRFSFRPRNDSRFFGGKYPFIQTGDIVKASNFKDKVQYTQTLNELGLSVSKLFHPPQLVFTIAANIGDTAILDYPACFPDSIVSVIPKKKQLSIEFLNVYFKLVKKYTSELAPFAAQRNLNNKQLGDFPVIIPPTEVQDKIIQIMNNAYSRKKQNEEEAERLLNSYSELINEFVDINLNSSTQRKIFSINFEDFEGALNPERYANRLTLDRKHSWIQIQDIGDIIRDTFTPARTNTDTDFGLIRIDDLDNNPQDAVIRDVKGNDINGIILRVQKEDILVARLGPTLENKKTIITPVYQNELIASNEFICLRCNENINPVFILAFLKTDFYKNLMIQKSRGATPSRRRLSHEDFAELPFPDIDKSLQDDIANKFFENVSKARALKKEAIEALEQAKKEVEKILFE